MSGPNTLHALDASERLKQAVAILGATAVLAAATPLAAEATTGHKPAQGPHIDKPARGAKGIGTAIAIGIHGNRPVR